MRFRFAPIFAAGLALSGCATDVGTGWGFGGGGYPVEPYTYSYGGPYTEYGPVSPAYGYTPDYVAPYAAPPIFVAPFAYQHPGWDGGHWRHDRDWHEHGDWSHHGGNWGHGQPPVWAGHPGGGWPAHTAPPPAPHPPPPAARTQTSSTPWRKG